MLLAVQKSLAAAMKGCKSAMLGKAKEVRRAVEAFKTRSRKPSGSLASVRTSCSRRFEWKKDSCEHVPSVQMAGIGAALEHC